MKPLTYKQLGWLTFWLWLGFVVGMSALVSHDMAAHPRAQVFADFMAQFIPMLDNIRRIPGATEWVRFYYAVFWAVSPIFVGLAWRISDLYMTKRTMPPVSPFKWIASVAVTGFGFLIMLYWPVADGLGWRDQTMATNIVGIGHHSLMTVFIWVVVGGSLRGSYYYLLRGTPYWPCGKSAQAAANEERQ
ncbi:MAG: hypothetical protein WCR20_15795 [Verrucomicrobiota bacterium]